MESRSPIQFQRTRIAPTPSGYLHLGNAYSFALTASIARKYGAKVLLRIDDLDRERVNPLYVQDVFDTLNFLGIEWDEGPRNMTEYQEQYSQIYRMDSYRGMLAKLQDLKAVFACTCSRAQVLAASPSGIYPGTCRHKNIPLDSPGVTWRLDTSKEETLHVFSPDGKHKEAMLPGAMQYFVVRKKDGFPAYQLASLADDVHFGIDLIVRGADLWDSTLAQLYLARILGLREFEQVRFHHHSLKLAPNGQKLSKSAGDTSIQFLRRNGMTADEIYRSIGYILKD
ncbi:tRNA glutamyl-Q synthetase [Mucilaginibacter terrenus]|uniref:tRNA glutamyl-Q synthetase n=1 Tax=Mucilaginibacter terrenus TaxID=2482727 RepID=A0A3E2NTC1_9SPHI|nr:glutamate--tRNA ligase family protein [Mucilaginibacter terrenus]RFZ84256.1 tRNA glutamyl-Q synthetase [Mucilaginibacter terrenus]